MTEKGKHKVPIEELKHREYLTANQASLVFGRGPSYWRRCFDWKLVEGYQEGRNRYLKTESIRAYLDGKEQDVNTKQLSLAAKKERIRKKLLEIRNAG